MLFKSVTVKIAISLSFLKYISSVLLSLKTTALSLAHKNSDLTTFSSTLLFSAADLFSTVTVTLSIHTVIYMNEFKIQDNVSARIAYMCERNSDEKS